MNGCNMSVDYVNMPVGFEDAEPEVGRLRQRDSVPEPLDLGCGPARDLALKGQVAAELA